MSHSSDSWSVQIPPDVTAAIAHALAVPRLVLTRLAGGTNSRTYRATHGRRSLVARVEREPALSLLRAVKAQGRAHAAGVRTPVTIAYDITATTDGRYVWSVETLARGRPFAMDTLSTERVLVRAADLGRQLRRLHAVTVDAFGDLPPRPYPVYPSFGAWVANKARRIPEAVAIADGRSETATSIAAVYAALATWYGGPPCLCKGDCAGDNILVDSQNRTTIIDWEWAQGLDPAADVAYWYTFTPEPRAHEALLAAYAPDDPPSFRRRVWAHQVVQCVETIHVYDQHRHAFDDEARTAGVRASWETLLSLLASGASNDTALAAKPAA
jgi:aminoglycoside phosphotransferase (APT) family kinase protein